ncbi:MAG: S9 family peptidase [Gammaproteobacteria bacterium]|nr:S9 family peptidase [Gammaproteobacteria bacterium]
MLIPRQILFGDPDRAFALISPDGASVASLAPVGGVMNIVIAPVADPGAEKPLTQETDRRIGHCAWACDGRSMLFLADRNGDENWHLYRVRLADAGLADLTPGDRVRARLLELSPRYPGEVLVEIRSPDAGQCGLFRIDLKTGSRREITGIPAFQQLLTDDFEPLLGIRPRPDGGMDWFVPRSGDWEPAASIPAADAMTTYPVGLGGGGRFFLIDSRGRDKAALVEWHPGDGSTRVLFEDETADVSDVLLDVRGQQPLAVAVTPDRKQWRALDAGTAAEFDYLHGRCHGDISLASRSADDRHWVIGYRADNAPVAFYHYDRRNGEARYLFNNSERLAAMPLVGMHTARLQAHDGLPLQTYYSLPAQGEAPYPAVLLVHGGPWARDDWGFQPWHQWLANRGYAVLSVNYRGSTGYGKAFLNAGNREWGRAMQADLLDTVDWAVREGIADGDRIGIMGTSYGGYATLAALAFTPTRFACGIDLMGPSHLVSLLEAIPPQWQSQREFFVQRVGDPDSEAGRADLGARSPLPAAGRISRPLLIAQGANDPRVPRAESDRIVEELQARNIPVIYLLFPDEGHGLARPGNRLALCAIAEAFLARELGGSVEPPGADPAQSAVQVLAGGDLIPELASLLPAGTPQ